jgi:uncharacterized protein YndB with AHSA1/START domain
MMALKEAGKMAESLKLSVDLPVSPERVFRAWFDSYEYSRFTGSPAKIDPQVGGQFTARNGAIQGKTLVKTPFSHIVQTWRTNDFPAGSPDSRVDILLEPTCTGSQLTLTQTQIPDGQARKLMQAWEKDFFRPLLHYFEELVGETGVDMDG